MPLKFVKSQKGKNLLVDGGYLYIKEKNSLNITIWRCVEYTSAKCRGRCHTKNDEVIHTSNNHNHVANTAEIECKTTVERIRESAVNRMDAPQAIIAQETICISQSVAVTLPSVPSLKRTIQRARQRTLHPIGCPSSLTELCIPDEYQNTFAGEKFLLHDSGAGEGRILIFSTKRNLDLMSSCRNWYADGTFKVSPPLFAQVYTIHGVQYSNVVPTLYALLPNKSEETYVKLLSALKDLKPDLQPQTVMTDFETAAINAFRSVFPNIRNRGCFFHLCQSFYRHIQNCPEILSHYNDADDPDFALNLRQIPALAYVPEEAVVETFDALLESEFFQKNYEILQPLLDYFEDNYIGRPTRLGKRRSPKFPISLWNCFQTTAESIPRTNNSVEGWHRSFSSHLSVHHPSIWKFIEGLRKEQSLNELKIEQYIAGEPLRKQKKIYRDTAKRIETIVSEYGERPDLDYLKGIAHNFKLQQC